MREVVEVRDMREMVEVRDVGERVSLRCERSGRGGRCDVGEDWH